MNERAVERRSAREHALRFLFGLEFTQGEWDDALVRYWETVPDDQENALPAGMRVRRYAETLIRGVSENAASLDARISDALENWTPGRIGHVERAVLRIAAFEMLHQPDVPATVAINEAIEIAKLYGADDAPRFVNGVLDRLRVQSVVSE